MESTFLTEATLGLFLTERLPKGTWKYNTTMPGSRIRPDYCNDYYKLIVEFDGYHHFSDPRTIIRDKKRNLFYAQNNYTFIHIPYFIQLDRAGVNVYFCEYTKKPFNDYPHGFIDSKAMLPAQFCSIGIQSFVNIMHFLRLSEKDTRRIIDTKDDWISINIMKSLVKKIVKGLPFAQVFPLDFIKTLNIHFSYDSLNNELNSAINNELCEDREMKQKLLENLFLYIMKD